MKENRGTAGKVPGKSPQGKTSKKYRRLSDLLEASENDAVTLTFSQIEKILGFSLPASAREHRAFWANTATHSIALSWLGVGFETVDVNLAAETIVFERA